MSESENESRPAKHTKKKVGSPHTTDPRFQQEGIRAAPRERAQGHSQKEQEGGHHWRPGEGFPLQTQSQADPQAHSLPQEQGTRLQRGERGERRGGRRQDAPPQAYQGGDQDFKIQEEERGHGPEGALLVAALPVSRAAQDASGGGEGEEVLLHKEGFQYLCPSPLNTKDISGHGGSLGGGSVDVRSHCKGPGAACADRG